MEFLAKAILNGGLQETGQSQRSYPGITYSSLWNTYAKQFVTHVVSQHSIHNSALRKKNHLMQDKQKLDLMKAEVYI